MRAATACLLLTVPALLCAQEFQFRQEFDTIPVEIDGWQPFAPWMGGMSESNPALADIDADGDLDFFVGEYPGNLEFYRNDGDSTIPEFNLINSQFDSIVVDARLKACFGDLDADGDLDLVLSDDWPHVLFYRNLGTSQQPNYVLEDSSLVPGPPWCGGPELIDIDADGDLDLFGGNLGSVSFFQNSGTAQNFSFNLVTGGFAGVGVGSWARPDFVDIDADGDYDLFVGNSVGRIYYYRNNGDSVNYDFTYMTNNYANIDVGDLSSPEFADIDGDGDYDLFVGREAELESLLGDVYYYQNIGSPQVAAFRMVTSNFLSLDVSYVTTEPKIVDLNDDAASELIIATANLLDYFENIGDSINGNFIFVQQGFQNILVPAISPFFADLDADGDQDLLCGEGVIPGPPTISLYLNEGSAQSPEYILYNSQFITNPNFFVFVAPVLADIDSDGDFDLLISDNDGHFFYYRNDGTAQWPNFTLLSSQWQGLQFAYPYDGAKGMAFGDLDGDGDLDLLLTSPAQTNLYFYRNIGSPQVPNLFLESQQFLPAVALYGAWPYLADIDADQDLDLFIGNYSGGVYFFRNITGEPPGIPPRPCPAPYRGPVLTLGPNPANPLTVITFSLPYPQEATLAVYNLLGAKVTTLASGLQPAGTRSFIWDARDKASGVYIVKLEAGQAVQEQKMIIIK